MNKLFSLSLFSFLLLCFFFSFESCKKTDSINAGADSDRKITQQFFNLSPNEHPLVKKIAAEIQKRNNANPFVAVFAKENGFPVWNKAILAPKKKNIAARNENVDAADTVVFIPLVLANTVQVNGSILAKVQGDSVFLKYVLAQDYKAYSFASGQNEVTANEFAALMFVLNREVFGYTTFTITDQKLFADPSYPDPDSTIKQVSFDTSRIDNLNIPAEVCVFFIISVCEPSSAKMAARTPGPLGTNCIYYDGEECYNIYDDTGGWGGAPGGPPEGGELPGGGGGGTTIPHSYPCSSTGTCNPPGGGIGWLPPVSMLDDYNPYIADSVIIDTSVSNNYPCLLNIIDTISTFANLNQQAQVALSTIFGVNKYIHTTIKIDRSLVGTNTNAYTRRTGTLPVGQDKDSLDFSATIFLSPDLLNYASKEYIAGTLMHEAMHAFISYYFTLYDQGYIDASDSNIVKSKFPIFWGISVDSLATQLNQHQIIANNWVNNIYRSLFAFTNNEMSYATKDSVFRAISWAGLENTDIFKLQSNSCTIRAINIAASDSNNPVPFGIVGHPECATSYTYSQSSLKLKNLCQ